MRFPLPNVAIEDGVTEVAPEHGPPSRARYTIMHVKKDGQWQIDSVRDATYIPPTNYDNLRGLEWAIGDRSRNPQPARAHTSLSRGHRTRTS